MWQRLHRVKFDSPSIVDVGKKCTLIRLDRAVPDHRTRVRARQPLNWVALLRMNLFTYREFWSLLNQPFGIAPQGQSVPQQEVLAFR